MSCRAALWQRAAPRAAPKAAEQFGFSSHARQRTCRCRPAGGKTSPQPPVAEGPRRPRKLLGNNRRPSPVVLAAKDASPGKRSCWRGAPFHADRRGSAPQRRRLTPQIRSSEARGSLAEGASSPQKRQPSASAPSGHACAGPQDSPCNKHRAARRLNQQQQPGCGPSVDGVQGWKTWPILLYINLDRSKERKVRMEEQFKQYNIKNYKRVPAFDGRKLFSDSSA